MEPATAKDEISNPNNFKIWMKMQKTLKSQSNPKKEEKTLSIMFPDLHCSTKL